MQKTIFVVDDSDANLTKAKQALESQYRVFPLPSAAKLLALLEKIIPDIMLLDIEMPGMSGIDLVEKIKENPVWADIPFLFMTGWEEDLMMTHCLELGALDIVQKPFSDLILLKRVGNCLNLDTFAKRAQYLDSIQKSVACVLPDVIEMRDAKTTGHVERIAAYTKLMIHALLAKNVYAEALRTWDMDTVTVAAMFHDVGKIAIPEKILNGSNLSMDDYAVLWRHAAAGEQIIDEMIAKSGANDLWHHAKRFAACHHENWNGSGYPRALKEDQIALEGRIIAVVDMYDGLRCGRHQAAVDHNRAVGLIQQDSAVRYDPQIVTVFLEIQNAIAQIADAKNAQDATANAPA